MLKTFREFGVKATWAAVGMALCGSKAMLKAMTPVMRPSYVDARLDPYRHLDNVGSSESDDPYHFGASLAREIVSYPGNGTCQPHVFALLLPEPVRH